MVEPVRSRPVSAPRLAGTPGQLIVVRLAKAGTRIKRGDLLVEFDRTSQIKAARDREYEYRDILSQIEKKKGDQQIIRAGRELDVTLAENALRRAELDLLGIEMLPGITAEKNRLIVEEARAKVAQLRKTSDLRIRADTADLRSLEIQRQRAKNAWDHAAENAVKMRIVSPLDGLVVLKSIWKSGAMGEVQEGEEVRAGIPILDVVDPTMMRVRANVNQADAAQLVPGAPVRITLDSYPARTFAGKVEYISPVAVTSSMSQRVRSFLAVFSVDGTDEHLLPDLAAAIDIAPSSTGEARR
jgi:HlyD family secretion protein